ncbi:hypothetical protein ZTR_09629 [Talaromyces verruculosus]|nr:hypothetical protein ZTR_09629 [Talaromyces verruculosus]
MSSRSSFTNPTSPGPLDPFPSYSADFAGSSSSSPVYRGDTRAIAPFLSSSPEDADTIYERHRAYSVNMDRKRRLTATANDDATLHRRPSALSGPSSLSHSSLQQDRPLPSLPVGDDRNNFIPPDMPGSSRENAIDLTSPPSVVAICLRCINGADKTTWNTHYPAGSQTQRLRIALFATLNSAFGIENITVASADGSTSFDHQNQSNNRLPKPLHATDATLLERSLISQSMTYAILLPVYQADLVLKPTLLIQHLVVGKKCDSFLSTNVSIRDPENEAEDTTHRNQVLDDFLGHRTSSSTPTPIEPIYGQQSGSSRHTSSSSLSHPPHQSSARVQSYSFSSHRPRLETESGTAPFDPSGTRPRRVRSMAESDRTRTSRPPHRVPVDERDICPICSTQLPPRRSDGNEDEREAHIRDCIARSSGSSPGMGSPQSSHLLRMLSFTATEKDCLSEDSTPQECIICMEEYEVGDKLARLECLCKFHKSCIVGWFERKKECPVHKFS